MKIKTKKKNFCWFFEDQYKIYIYLFIITSVMKISFSRSLSFFPTIPNKPKKREEKK